MLILNNREPTSYQIGQQIFDQAKKYNDWRFRLEGREFLPSLAIHLMTDHFLMFNNNKWKEGELREPKMPWK
jgi:hypothetical protein